MKVCISSTGRRPLGQKVGSMSKPGNEGNGTNTAVTLKAVANHLGLSPGTVSSVLNNAPSARHIPQHTRNRIVAAARELNYRPNFFARSLRKQRNLYVGRNCCRFRRRLRRAGHRRDRKVCQRAGLFLHFGSPRSKPRLAGNLFAPAFAAWGRRTDHCWT